jgi:hypothetical protein
VAVAARAAAAELPRSAALHPLHHPLQHHPRRRPGRPARRPDTASAPGTGVRPRPPLCPTSRAGTVHALNRARGRGAERVVSQAARPPEPTTPPASPADRRSVLPSLCHFGTRCAVPARPRLPFWAVAGPGIKGGVPRFVNKPAKAQKGQGLPMPTGRPARSAQALAYLSLAPGSQESRDTSASRRTAGTTNVKNSFCRNSRAPGPVAPVLRIRETRETAGAIPPGGPGVKGPDVLGSEGRSGGPVQTLGLISRGQNPCPGYHSPGK